MSEEFSTEVVKHFTGDIASRFGKAAALATTATGQEFHAEFRNLSNGG